MLPVNVAHRLIAALADNDTAVLDKILPGNAYLQVRGNGRMQLFWTRPRVRAALLAEFSRCPRPIVTIGDVTPHTSSIGVTFQIEAVENGRLAKYDYFALLVPRNGQIQTIILYSYHEAVSAPVDVWSLSFPSDHTLLKRVSAPRIGSLSY